MNGYMSLFATGADCIMSLDNKGIKQLVDAMYHLRYCFYGGFYAVEYAKGVTELLIMTLLSIGDACAETVTIVVDSLCCILLPAYVHLAERSDVIWDFSRFVSPFGSEAHMVLINDLLKRSLESRGKPCYEIATAIVAAINKTKTTTWPYERSMKSCGR